MADHYQPTILVADDEAGHRTLLEMVLSADGYKVDAVMDGREALQYLQKNTPDLVILDVSMPHVTGIDICERIKRISRLKDVPVIILTALKDERTREMAKHAQADEIVTKPLTGKDFRELVKKLLDNYLRES